MEVDDEDSQICRLCGQYENMVIDVFGEEGKKRLLGMKIHSKINILIDEKDPLPKTICVQCLGKLEFVCDFQEECLRTQQVLRDQFSLPPLSDVEELKADEQPAPSSSKTTNKSIECNTENRKINNLINNNNNTEKNFNAFEKDENRTPARIRNLRSLQKKDLNQTPTNKITDELSVRCLRSRSSTDSPLNESALTVVNNKKSASIAKRLRSHSNSSVSIDSSITSNASDVTDKSKSMMQIPTNTLNKVLSAISNSPGIGVSVKETTNRSDAEDISFTVELSKKQESDSLKVLAKVFPDQGSCLVDESIVTFLEDGSNEELNNLVNNIVKTKTAKNKKDNLINILQNTDDLTNILRNPEELFKMDGEEIHVDDKLEQVTINNVLNYQCKICNRPYERKDKCIVHVKTHLNIKQYICILCQARFVCKSDVMKHIRCSHTNPRPISCSKCPKRFRSKFDLAEHQNVHKGIRPYQCADCDQSYHHKVSLQMHVKSHLPPQNLACEYCGKIFPYRTRLLSHVGSVHMKEKRNFRCRFCYNLYSSLAVLNEHIKTRHTTTYTCETCGKTFKVSSKYKAHVLQHSNPKPFVCSICNNRYASKAFLNEHVLKHQGLRKHVCQKCGASFAQASHLAAHRHVHGEKTHICTECGKTFNRRDNMKVHMKRHAIAAEKRANSSINSKSSSCDENMIDDDDNEK